MKTFARTSDKQAALANVREYVELTKPRIAAMVLLTVVVAGILALPAGHNLMSLIHVAVGVLLIASSGSAWNQYLERYTDYLMPRTARRPLPKFRLTATQVALFGAMTLGMGIAYLAAMVNWEATLLGIATWVMYVVVYTPLKRRTWWNTSIGAVAGAMPILIGAAATGTTTSLVWVFFATLFLWQFPHFMAIAWLYRADYASAELKMTTVVDPSGRLAGWHAVLGATALLPTTLAGALCFETRAVAAVYAAAALCLGVWYLLASFRFFFATDDQAARRLMRVSLLYLPLLMIALVLAFAMRA